MARSRPGARSRRTQRGLAQAGAVERARVTALEARFATKDAIIAEVQRSILP